MNPIHTSKVACGLPICQKNEEEQTHPSIALRATAVVLGVIALILGALIVTETLGLGHLGPACGYSVLTVGIILEVAGISIKYIRTQIDPQLEQNSDPIRNDPSDQGLDNTAKEASTLNALIKCAKKEGEAFLIDFSKINPSTIFEIFDENSHCEKAFGDAAISRNIPFDDSEKFKQNYPFKYRMTIVVQAKSNDDPQKSWGYQFHMNDEGKVESYGKVFDNFDLYLEDKMDGGIYKFQHLDFQSVSTSNGSIKLRKKSFRTR